VAPYFSFLGLGFFSDFLALGLGFSSAFFFALGFALGFSSAFFFGLGFVSILPSSWPWQLEHGDESFLHTLLST
jgi:hypothetical protein